MGVDRKKRITTAGQGGVTRKHQKLYLKRAEHWVNLIDTEVGPTLISIGKTLALSHTPGGKENRLSEDVKRFLA